MIHNKIIMLPSVCKYFAIALVFITSPLSTSDTNDDFRKLKVAVLDNDVNTVHQLLLQNATDWLTENRGWEIARIAAEKGNLPVIQYIAERKLSILEKKNEENETIGHIAARHGHSEITEYFLNETRRSYGSPSSSERESLFDLIAEKGYLNCISGFVSRYSEDLTRIAKIAAQNGHLEVACSVALEQHVAYCKDFGGIIETAMKNSRRRDPKTLELLGKLTDHWGSSSYCPSIVEFASSANDTELMQYLAENKCIHFLKCNEYSYSDSASKRMEIAFERNLVNRNFLNCLVKGNGTVHGYIGESKLTICHLAAKYDRLDVVRLLVEKNASVLERPDIYGRTVVNLAAEKGYSDIVCYAVRQNPCATVLKTWQMTGGDIGPTSYYFRYYSTAFHLAIAKNIMDTGTLRDVVENEGTDLITRADSDDGATAAHLAAAIANMEILQYLVKKKPSVLSISNSGGETVLHILARKRQFNEKWLKFFVDMGAPLSVKNRGQETVGHILAKNRRTDFVEYLAGRDPSILTIGDDSSDTILHVLARGTHAAAKDANMEVLQYFVKKKPPVLSIQNSQGDTVLHILVRKKKLEEKMLQFFVDLGAPLVVKNSNGDTIGHILAKYGHPALVKYLVEKDPSILAIGDVCGDTILHILARRNALSVEDLGFFVDKGASLIARNNKTENIALIASKTGNLEVLRFIAEKDSSIFKGKAKVAVKMAQIAATRGHSNILKFIADQEPILLADSPQILFILSNVSEVVGMLQYLQAACEAKINNWDRGTFECKVSSEALKVDCPDILRSMNYDVNMVNDEGEPLILAAVRRNRSNVFHYLAEDRRTNLSALDHGGNNILFIAALNGDLEKMRYILDTLKAPIDIEWPNRDGNPLLHVAVHVALAQADRAQNLTGDQSTKEGIRMIKYLVEEKHALTDTAGHENMTALHCATLRGNYFIYSYLLDHGARPEMRDASGSNFWQVLHFPSIGTSTRTKVTEDRS